jgi:TonB family protein
MIMEEYSQKDRDRFLLSVVIAGILHFVLFIGLHFILNIRLEAMPEYTGPLYLEIGTEFEQEFDVKEIIPEEEEKQEKESAAEEKKDNEKRTESSSEVVRRDDREDKSRTPEQTEPEENTVKDDAEHSSPDYENAEKTEDTQASKEEKFPDKTPLPTPVPSLTPTPYDPALEEDSLAQLDKLLDGESSDGTDSGKDTEKDSTTTKRDDSSTGEGGGPIIVWEDNRDRNPVDMPDPVIPDWVSRQGLRLKVKVSFLLTPDGIITSLHVIESSGYPDVDSRIVEALRKWRFPSVSGTKNVYGEITYFIGLK